MVRLVLLLFLLIFSLNTTVLAEEPSRYVVETAFVYKFIKFVNWPEDQNDNIESINLCYLGNGKIIGSLNNLGGYEVKEKQIIIRKYSNIEMIKTCQIVFMDLPKKSERNWYLNRLKNESILTISHFNGFIDEGGMINLFVINLSQSD